MSNQNNDMNRSDQERVNQEQSFVGLFFEILCSAMGVDPESQEASEMIIPAYQEPENGPRPPRNKDLVYYYLMTDDAEEARYQTVEIRNRRMKVSAFTGYQLVIICYGPHCMENAHTIRYFLYLDGKGMPRNIMRKHGIYPIPSPRLPAVSWEENGSLWRKRADLTVQLRRREQQVYEAEQGMILVAPEVVIHSNT